MTELPGDVTTRSAASSALRAQFRGSSLHGAPQNVPPVSTEGTLQNGTPGGAHAVEIAAMRIVASRRASRWTKQTNKFPAGVVIGTGVMGRVAAQRAACQGAPKTLANPLPRIAVDPKGTVS